MVTKEQQEAANRIHDHIRALNEMLFEAQGLGLSFEANYGVKPSKYRVYISGPPIKDTSVTIPDYREIDRYVNMGKDKG